MAIIIAVTAAVACAPVAARDAVLEAPALRALRQYHPLPHALLEATTAAAAARARLANDTGVDSDETEPCEPACDKTKGICVDGVCFCKSPYQGSTCGEEAEVDLRVHYPMAAACALLSLVVGTFFACSLFELVSSARSEVSSYLTQAGTEASVRRKETWRPMTTARSTQGRSDSDP